METSYYSFEVHQFEIIDCDDKICSIKFASCEGKAFDKERRKLYIVQDGSNILYIGEANCSIKTRFQRACGSYNYFCRTGKAKGGYKGYKWLDKRNNSERELRVSVAIFNNHFDENRDFIEAVEGELVFLIRQQLGYWPIWQNEIHFKNDNEAIIIAQNIINRWKNFR